MGRDSTEITTKLHITLKLHISKDSTVITTQLLYIIREHSMDIMKRLHSTRIGPTMTTLPTHITTTEDSKEITTLPGHITTTQESEITALSTLLLTNSEFEMINYQK